MTSPTQDDAARAAFEAWWGRPDNRDRLSARIFQTRETCDEAFHAGRASMDASINKLMGLYDEASERVAHLESERDRCDLLEAEKVRRLQRELAEARAECKRRQRETLDMQGERIEAEEQRDELVAEVERLRGRGPDAD